MKPMLKSMTNGFRRSSPTLPPIAALPPTHSAITGRPCWSFTSGTKKSASELCRLVAGDIDGNERLVRVRGKGRKERLIPIGETALAAIKTYWDLLPQPPGGESPVFFVSPKKLKPL